MRAHAIRFLSLITSFSCVLSLSLEVFQRQYFIDRVAEHICTETERSDEECRDDSYSLLLLLYIIKYDYSIFRIELMMSLFGVIYVIRHTVRRTYGRSDVFHGVRWKHRVQETGNVGDIRIYRMSLRRNS